MTTTHQSPADRRIYLGNQWKLSAAQLFSGVGVAVGFAVGGLLAEELTGRAEYAGFAQTASITGAGILAIPLARLAERHSRRISLSTGFIIALLGAATILLGARLGSPIIFFAGMLAFGSATATGLQARYAAADTAPEHMRGRALSIVVWATTVGSVAGPNLVGIGARVGTQLSVGTLAGSFALSAVAYAVAILFTSRLQKRRIADVRQVTDSTAAVLPSVAEAGSADLADTANPAQRVDPAGSADLAGRVDPAQRVDPDINRARSAPAPATRTTMRQAWEVIRTRPQALLGFAAVVLGHTVMVSVMVMTPVHMSHSGDTLNLIGIVISLHIVGMYALSPVFGYLADRIGPQPVIWLGLALLAASAVLGINDDVAGSTTVRISAALILLGLGWSACFIAGSTLLTAAVPATHRVPIQGMTDAAMNFGAAIFAAAAGPLLTLGGFTLINAVALAIVTAGVLLALRTRRSQLAGS